MREAIVIIATLPVLGLVAWLLRYSSLTFVALFLLCLVASVAMLWLTRREWIRNLSLAAISGFACLAFVETGFVV